MFTNRIEEAFFYAKEHAYIIYIFKTNFLCKHVYLNIPVKSYVTRFHPTFSQYYSHNVAITLFFSARIEGRKRTERENFISEKHAIIIKKSILTRLRSEILEQTRENIPV